MINSDDISFRDLRFTCYGGIFISFTIEYSNNSNILTKNRISTRIFEYQFRYSLTSLIFCAYTRPSYQVSFYRTIGPLVFLVV